MTVCRLSEADAAPEEAVFGEGRLDGSGVAHSRLLIGCREQCTGPPIVPLCDHQATRDGADAPFDEARMMVEDQAVDPRIPQQRLQPGEADGIVGAQQFLHRVRR